MGLERAKEFVNQFMTIAGPGQFTWERFAGWMVENYPIEAAEALGEALRSLPMPQLPKESAPVVDYCLHPGIICFDRLNGFCLHPACDKDGG